MKILMMYKQLMKCRKNLGLKSSESQETTSQIIEHLPKGENIGIWHKETKNSEYYTKDNAI